MKFLKFIYILLFCSLVSFADDSNVVINLYHSLNDARKLDYVSSKYQSITNTHTLAEMIYSNYINGLFVDNNILHDIRELDERIQNLVDSIRSSPKDGKLDLNKRSSFYDYLKYLKWSGCELTVYHNNSSSYQFDYRLAHNDSFFSSLNYLINGKCIHIVLKSSNSSKSVYTVHACRPSLFFDTCSGDSDAIKNIDLFNDINVSINHKYIGFYNSGGVRFTFYNDSSDTRVIPSGNYITYGMHSHDPGCNITGPYKIPNWIEPNVNGCQCDCENCKDNSCESCTKSNCKDKNCIHSQSDGGEDDPSEDEEPTECTCGDDEDCCDGNCEDCQCKKCTCNCESCSVNNDCKNCTHVDCNPEEENCKCGACTCDKCPDCYGSNCCDCKICHLRICNKGKKVGLLAISDLRTKEKSFRDDFKLMLTIVNKMYNNEKLYKLKYFRRYPEFDYDSMDKSYFINVLNKYSDCDQLIFYYSGHSYGGNKIGSVTTNKQPIATLDLINILFDNFNKDIVFIYCACKSGANNHLIRKYIKNRSSFSLASAAPGTFEPYNLGEAGFFMTYLNDSVDNSKNKSYLSIVNYMKDNYFEGFLKSYDKKRAAYYLPITDSIFIYYFNNFDSSLLFLHPQPSLDIKIPPRKTTGDIPYDPKHNL